MTKVDIEINIESYNFYWSEYRIAPSSWEDLWVYYKIKGKKKAFFTELRTHEALKMARRQNERIKSDPFFGSTEGEESWDWYKAVYGKTSDEILASKEMVFGYFYSYDGRDDEEFEEITDYSVELPSWNGMKPSYIGGAIPHEAINKKVVEEFVALYFKTFLNLEVGTIKFRKDIPFDKAKKEWEETEAEHKKHMDFIKAGGEMEILFHPGVMDDLYGKKIMERYGDTLKCAKPIKDTNEILLEFKDGHTEIFDPEKKEWE